MSQQIDLSNYESDDILVGLAKKGLNDKLEVLLQDTPYSLGDAQSIRVAQAMINKYEQGMFFLYLFSLCACVSCIFYIVFIF